MTLQEIRKERLQRIKRSLEKSKNPDEELLIAKCCFEWGTSRRTVLEYIKMVKLLL